MSEQPITDVQRVFGMGVTPSMHRKLEKFLQENPSYRPVPVCAKKPDMEGARKCWDERKKYL